MGQSHNWSTWLETVWSACTRSLTHYTKGDSSKQDGSSVRTHPHHHEHHRMNEGCGRCSTSRGGSRLADTATGHNSFCTRTHALQSLIILDFAILFVMMCILAVAMHFNWTPEINLVRPQLTAFWHKFHLRGQLLC